LTYVFSSKWGGFGTADGQLKYPSGVALDSSGNVFVVDLGNNRIQKFTSSGNFIKTWGGLGSGDSQFNYPIGIAVDSSGNVYVSDRLNHRIKKFRNDGTFIRAWGTLGSADELYYWPSGVAVDLSGNVFVADLLNSRILKFGSDGTFIRTWGTQGSAVGQLKFQMDIAVDSSGNVSVADIHVVSSEGVSESGNGRIQKFEGNGIFTTKWGSRGSADGQFIAPHGIAIKSAKFSLLEERVFVADTANNRIQVFKPKIVVHP
jgi:DNA-binding beta-propeller fold protein YncE